MIVECSGQCGLAEPSSAVEQPGRPVDALYDPASLAEGGPPLFPPATPMTDFATNPFKYCVGNNIEVAASSNRLVAEHQCYKKCEAEAPCSGGACFCDGFFPGYDQADSDALCLPLDSCKSLCSHLPGCASVDMHRSLNRCFLNMLDCFDGSGEASPLWVPSPSYDHVMKMSIRRLEEIGKSLTEAEIRRLLVPQDYGLSWDQLNRYQDVVFANAGTYKVCGCVSVLDAGPVHRGHREGARLRPAVPPREAGVRPRNLREPGVRRVALLPGRRAGDQLAFQPARRAGGARQGGALPPRRRAGRPREGALVLRLRHGQAVPLRLLRHRHGRRVRAPGSGRHDGGRRGRRDAWRDACPDDAESDAEAVFFPGGSLGAGSRKPRRCAAAVAQSARGLAQLRSGREAAARSPR